MTIRKTTLKSAAFVLVAIPLALSAIAAAGSRQASRALAPSAATPAPESEEAVTPAPLPPFRAQSPGPLGAAGLSSTLSYYFIPGAEFTSDIGGAVYYRQADGCVNQMLLGYPFSAGVHLPQGSQVVAIRLYTYNSISTTTVSDAYYIANDSMGSGGYYVSAHSLPSTVGYQQHDSTEDNPSIINNQDNNYYVQWRTSGASPSPILSLCGVRVAYYAPLGSMFLPVISR